ncbi:MAG TPA: hypothetical protein VGL38_13105 [bacterium]|jgi:hypothetical protein
MRRTVLLMIILFSFCLAAHAEISLMLEATIQLPQMDYADGWDVQHWMSDSTFGWVHSRHDTVLYCPQLGDTVITCILPGQTHWPHYYLHLIRVPGLSTHACVIGANYQSYEDDDETLLASFDLTAGQLLDALSFGYSGSFGQGMYWESYGESIASLLPWPPPPAPSGTVAVTVMHREHSESDGGHWTRSRTESYGSLYFYNPTSFDVPQFNAGCGDEVSAFMESDPTRFVYNGSHHLSTDYDYEHSFDSCLVNTLIPVNSQGAPNYALGCDGTIAQQDADGTERVIVYSKGYPYRVQTLDPDDYSILWQDTTVATSLYSARLGDSGNERLLAYQAQTHRFHVYDAANGLFLDSTANMLGNLQYLIKRPGFLSEFVTCDSATMTVRVYTTAQPDPMALTCSFIPESNLIHLSWPDLGATQYYIYSSPTPGSTETLEAIVPAPQHSYDLTPQGNKRFYFVTAE